MTICLICVLISGAILYFANDTSFMYDDEDQIDEEEDDHTSEEEDVKDEMELKSQNREVETGETM